MNILHPVDALVVAQTHLESLRASARAEEAAALARRRPARRSATRHSRRMERDGRLDTSDRPSEVFCSHG